MGILVGLGALGLAITVGLLSGIRLRRIARDYPTPRDEGDELADMAEAGGRVEHDDPRWTLP